MTFGCRLSQFLVLQRSSGYPLSVYEEDLLFPDPANESLALINSVDGFPILQHVIHSRMNEGFCLKSRYMYYRGKPASAVSCSARALCWSVSPMGQLERVRQAYKVASFGRPVELFRLVQDHVRLFCEMLPDHSVYQGLPATKYSLDPAGHAGDTENLARLLGEAART